MDQAVHRVFRFDSFTLDLSRGCLRVGEQDVDLRPKAFEVLRLLAENAGRLVGKDELCRTVWPDVVVSDDLLVQCIGELRRKLGDDEHQLIKTVSRRGYLLDTSATTSRPHTGAPDVVPGVETGAAIASWFGHAVQSGNFVPRRWLSIGVTTVIAAALIATVMLWARTGSGIPLQVDNLSGAVTDRRISLVVLPFQNMGGDPEEEYFSDGITEDLTNSLSLLAATVIARSTAFTYKGKLIDTRQIGRELSVRYVVEGTVNRSSNRVRVTTRLLDTRTGTNILSETFDVDGRDLSGLRDDVTARLANFLSLELLQAQRVRSLLERPDNPEAVDFSMRATALWARTPKGRDVSEPRRLFVEALRRDDTLVNAWTGLAMTYIRDVRFSASREQDLVHASEAAERAMALGPGSAWSHLVTGWVLYERKRIEQALAAFEHATVLNHNLPFAHASVAAANLVLGRGEQALEPLRKAMRLSPRDPELPIWQMFMGAVHLHLGRDSEAVHWLTKSVALSGNDPFTHLFLASALALSDRKIEAEAQLAELLRLKPEFTLTRLKGLEPSDAPAFRAQRERIYAGLRLAGVPE